MHNAILNNDIRSSDLCAIEVDTAIPDSNSDGSVGQCVKDLSILQQRGVTDIVDNDVLAEDADDLLVGEGRDIDGGESAVLGCEDGDAGGLADGPGEVGLGQEGGEDGEVGEEGECAGDGAGDFEETVVGGFVSGEFGAKRRGGDALRSHGPNDTSFKGDIITHNRNNLTRTGENVGHIRVSDRLLNKRLVDARAEVDNLRVTQQRLVDSCRRVSLLALGAQLLRTGSCVLHRTHGGNLGLAGGTTTGEGGVDGRLGVVGGVNDEVAADVDAGENTGVRILVDAGEVAETILLEGVD